MNIVIKKSVIYWLKSLFKWRGNFCGKSFKLYRKIGRLFFNKMKIQDDSVECTPLIDDKISIRTKLAYSLGHVFNDLAAAMWFTYTLIYLQRITLLEPLAAGFLLLLGELKDNITA